ncbi:MAG: hypothetical protein FWF03_08985, partial [Defluviitaleaceae bacterium]|nr:hypothetical protein [Defluviitaleaceae bacterium]
MRLRRTLAAVIAAVFLFTQATCRLFSGVEAENPGDKDPYGDYPPFEPEYEGGGGAGEPVTLRLLMDDNEAQSDDIAYRMLVKLGVRITAIPYGEADGNAAFELLNASGDGPDIFLAKTDPSRICKWITERAIRGLPEAILDDYPALSASLSGEGILRAYALLYGDRVWFIPKTCDREPQYSADG